MVDEAYVIIYKKQICVEFFAARLANLTPVQRELHGEFLDKVCDEITQETTVLKLWLKLTTYWNFLNYSLLEQVILKFGDTSLQAKMRGYKGTIRHFQQNTHLRDFANCSTTISMNLSKNLSLLAMKFEEHWDEYTLEDLEKFEKIFTHQLLLSSFALNPKEIKPGCIHVTWAIPAVIGASLKENIENTDMREFCKEHGITSITIDGEECKNLAAVSEYSTYLEYVYSKKKGETLAPYKLARIRKRKAIDRKMWDDYTRSTLRGDQDDVVYTKEHMDESKLGTPTYQHQLRFVLIEGAPGVGKTTFSEQFCYKWSQGQVLTNHRLLVLLPLRDNRVRSARIVSDLFQHPQLQQAIAEEVESSGGEGVALWLEAWDELGEEMRNKSSIFLDLVHGRVLPKATVIVTSRPWATKNLREDTNIKLDQHVEIVSTPSIQFNRVLREGKWLSQIHGLCEPEPHREAKFRGYVDNNPSIKAAMYTPVTADIVAEVFQWSRDNESTPPTTMTQLYTAFTCKLLMQHLSGHKEGNKSGKIRSLEEVPADMKGRLLDMCKLAWEGIVEQQLTFDSDVVGGDTLGLMQGVRELYGGEDGQLSYHFIHLTVQEFLSAYHITQLPPDKQEQVIREHVRTGHLNRVVMFYFGLTKPNHFTIGMISEQLSDGATAYHWLFEAGDVVTFTEELGSGREVRVKSSYSWSPLDYYVVGHSVAHYQFQWELDCWSASMGDEEMEMLSRGMASSAGGAWNGKIACYFKVNDISLEGVKWFVKIPLPLAGQIDKLDFARNKLDVHALNAFCEFVPKLAKLQELSLHGNPIGKGGAVEVFKCLHHYKTPLKELDFSGTGVGEEDCAQLALLIANTEVLFIAKNSLSSNSVASIMEGLLQNSTIQRLDMNQSHFSEENCMSLASLLQQAECQFRTLDIRECNISGEGAVHLAAALTNNHSLEELDISRSPIGDIGATAFGDMVRNNTALTILDLDKCGITSEGCVQLAARLTENTALQILWMRGNHVGVEGAKALSKVIEENKTLRMLWLDDDDSLGEGVDSLLASVQNNTTLKRLSLPRQYKRPADPRVLW